MSIQLFHLETDICTFHIRAPKSAFEITLHSWEGVEYHLYVGDDPGPVATYSEPYGACRAVAQHCTGYAEWDRAGIPTADYISAWKCDIDKRFKIQLISDYLDADPKGSFRGLVDYFEGKHSYILERDEVAELYRELLMTGQTNVKLSDWMVPAELSDMPEIADAWLPDEPDTEAGL